MGADSPIFENRDIATRDIGTRLPKSYQRPDAKQATTGKRESQLYGICRYADSSAQATAPLHHGNTHSAV